MKEQPTALRLADALDYGVYDAQMARVMDKAAAELRRLHADAEESAALRERLSEILRATAIALRGPEPELTRWSWHDLPDLAAALKAQRDALLEALKMMRDKYGEYACRACDRADAAIKAVEEGA